ncbi:MAG: AAA family ATPase [bacterium]|nr:AAA family ATPase [bacterium]
MLNSVKIKNYKSIHDMNLELGNINVFIGENGCGKSNILEALGMASAAYADDLSVESLSNKGIRVTKPRLTTNSFLGSKASNKIAIDLQFDIEGQIFDYTSTLIPEEMEDIYSVWKNIDDKKLQHTYEIFNNFNKTKELLDKAVSMFEIEKDIRLMINESENKTENKTEKLREEVIKMQKLLSGFESEEQWKKFLKLSYSHIQTNASFEDYLIYSLNTQSLRGITSNSKKTPLGLYGEGLDVLLANFHKEERKELEKYYSLISWLKKIELDTDDDLKFEGHKLGRSGSTLYFRDKYMQRKNNIFSAENANEGALHILFYLALFISQKTPSFFGIDNIESSLNPSLCRTIIKELAPLAKKNQKQALITTHNPAILDGLNLFDDTQRLFVVARDDNGKTIVERIKLKPEVKGKKLKLSEMWMRGHLGGIPKNF